MKWTEEIELWRLVGVKSAIKVENIVKKGCKVEVSLIDIGYRSLVIYPIRKREGKVENEIRNYLVYLVVVASSEKKLLSST